MVQKQFTIRQSLQTFDTSSDATMMYKRPVYIYVCLYIRIYTHKQKQS